MVNPLVCLSSSFSAFYKTIDTFKHLWHVFFSALWDENCSISAFATINDKRVRFPYDHGSDFCQLLVVFAIAEIELLAFFFLFFGGGGFKRRVPQQQKRQLRRLQKPAFYKNYFCSQSI